MIMVIHIIAFNIVHFNNTAIENFQTHMIPIPLHDSRTHQGLHLLYLSLTIG